MLYYTEKGKGKTVLLLHGFLENSKMWNYFQNELSGGYRVISVDLPGHGQSSQETNEGVNRMEYMADKVNEVLEHLEIEKVIVIGHSMGGYAALALADKFKYKIDGLGLFYSTTLPDDEIKKEQRQKAPEIAGIKPEDFIRLTIPNLFAQKDIAGLQPEIKTAVSWAKETSQTGISAALKGMRLRQDRTDVVKDLGKPVLVIIGEYDNTAKNAELRKTLQGFSNVSFYELPTGHMGTLEAPEENLAVIKNWLNENF
jgi:pimeloyl-ACP methyl ester carboxylesterase